MSALWCRITAKNSKCLAIPYQAVSTHCHHYALWQCDPKLVKPLQQFPVLNQKSSHGLLAMCIEPLTFHNCNARTFCSSTLFTLPLSTTKSKYISQSSSSPIGIFMIPNLSRHLYSKSRSWRVSGQTFSQERLYSQGYRAPDPGKESRLKKLLSLTYLSGFIGICLLGAIFYQQYGRMARTAQGVKEVKLQDREYGRRCPMFHYRGFVLPDFVVDDVRNIHPFEVREDDIWIVSFPKAGTTWVQEIVYLINTDLDFEGAKLTKINDRCPYFEFVAPGKKAINSMPSPRLIKTHLPFSLLPNQMKDKKPKIIYIMRNPKDTAVSFYHFAVKFLAPLNKFHGSFDRYCELFAEDVVSYGPWWKHVLEAWKLRYEDNVLVLTYEDLSKDLPAAVHQIASFLDKRLTDDQVNAIAQHCSFDSMKNNKSVNYDWMKEQGMAVENEVFMRKGKVGEWKNQLSAEIAEKLDEMVSSKLTPHGIVIQDTVAGSNQDNDLL